MCVFSSRCFISFTGHADSQHILTCVYYKNNLQKRWKVSYNSNKKRNMGFWSVLNPYRFTICYRCSLIAALSLRSSALDFSSLLTSSMYKLPSEWFSKPNENLRWFFAVLKYFSKISLWFSHQFDVPTSSTVAGLCSKSTRANDQQEFDRN